MLLRKGVLDNLPPTRFLLAEALLFYLIYPSFIKAMYHSDLRKEISYQQAQLDYKRRKLAESFQKKVAFEELQKLYDDISMIEEKLRVCFEEARTQDEA